MSMCSTCRTPLKSHRHEHMPAMSAKVAWPSASDILHCILLCSLLWCTLYPLLMLSVLIMELRHKKVEHLLASVYSGRIERTSLVNAPTSTHGKGVAAGGLTFAAIAQVRSHPLAA